MEHFRRKFLCRFRRLSSLNDKHHSAILFFDWDLDWVCYYQFLLKVPSQPILEFLVKINSFRDLRWRQQHHNKCWYTERSLQLLEINRRQSFVNDQNTDIASDLRHQRDFGETAPPEGFPYIPRRQSALICRFWCCGIRKQLQPLKKLKSYKQRVLWSRHKKKVTEIKHIHTSLVLRLDEKVCNSKTKAVGGWNLYITSLWYCILLRSNRDLPANTQTKEKKQNFTYRQSTAMVFKSLHNSGIYTSQKSKPGTGHEARYEILVCSRMKCLFNNSGGHEIEILSYVVRLFKWHWS